MENNYIFNVNTEIYENTAGEVTEIIIELEHTPKAIIGVYLDPTYTHVYTSNIHWVINNNEVKFHISTSFTQSYRVIFSYIW